MPKRDRQVRANANTSSRNTKQKTDTKDHTPFLPVDIWSNSTFSLLPLNSLMNLNRVNRYFSKLIHAYTRLFVDKFKKDFSFFPLSRAPDLTADENYLYSIGPGIAALKKKNIDRFKQELKFLISKQDDIKKTITDTNCLNSVYAKLSKLKNDSLNGGRMSEEVLGNLTTAELDKRLKKYNDVIESVNTLIATAQLTYYTEYLKISGITRLTPEFIKSNKKLLSKVRHLVLSVDNDLTTIPPEIRQFVELQVLSLYGNKLTTLPAEIGQLVELQQLYLSRNKLTTLPPEIGQLRKLEYLYLSDNELTTLPDTLSDINSIRQLLLEGNPLTALPAQMWKLLCLEKLRLTSTSLPVSIRRFLVMDFMNQDRVPDFEQRPCVVRYTRKDKIHDFLLANHDRLENQETTNLTLNMRPILTAFNSTSDDTHSNSDVEMIDAIDTEYSNSWCSIM